MYRESTVRNGRLWRARSRPRPLPTFVPSPTLAMPFDANQLMTVIRQDNPSFKRFTRTSHLDPILAELKDKKFLTSASIAKVERLTWTLPHDRVQRYARTLAYLRQAGAARAGVIPVRPVMHYVEFAYQQGAYVGTNSRGESKQVMLVPNDPTSPGPRAFLHRHRITWESSNGNPASLAAVRTREYVKFLTDTQAPPFNAIQDPDREFYAPGAQGTIGATEGTDDHSTKLPALICRNPRVPGTLVAQQWYQFSLDNGVTWHNIEGAAYLIEKTVQREANDWVYVFKKSNWAQHNTKPFHFEVHYTVAPPPEYMPLRDSDVMNIGTHTADIAAYARRVVATG